MKVKIILALAAAAAATATGVFARNNIAEEVAWTIGDDPIYKSEIEQTYQDMLQDRLPIKGDPYCAIPEMMAIQRLYIHQADLDTVKVRAGTNITKVNVKFLRTMRLREEPVKLVLKLLPNEHFKVLEKYKSSNSYSASEDDVVDGSKFSFEIDEVYSCPASWYTLNANNYFGPWTATKFIYINATLGFELPDKYKGRFIGFNVLFFST